MACCKSHIRLAPPPPQWRWVVLLNIGQNPTKFLEWLAYTSGACKSIYSPPPHLPCVVLSCVVLGSVVEVVRSNLAWGEIFTSAIGSVDLLYLCILFTKSRGYSNSKTYNIYQTNVINLKQQVLISKVISRQS